MKNCTVHHANNRAIAIHGVNHLTVSWNVVFDTRGHAVFIEDGPRCAIPIIQPRGDGAAHLVSIGGPVAGVLLDREP